MAEKRWFKDFPTEIKNGVTSDDYLEHKLRLITLNDIDSDISDEAVRYRRNIELFYSEGGQMENDDLTYTFKLRRTTISITFDDWFNVRDFTHKGSIQDREFTYDAKLICDFIEAIAKENAPDEAHKEVETMWRDVDNRHVVRGTAIAIQRILDIPTMLSIALGGKRLEDIDGGGDP